MTSPSALDWCPECHSWHATPRDKAHRKALGCKRDPWLGAPPTSDERRAFDAAACRRPRFRDRPRQE